MTSPNLSTECRAGRILAYFLVSSTLMLLLADNSFAQQEIVVESSSGPAQVHMRPGRTGGPQAIQPGGPMPDGKSPMGNPGETKPDEKPGEGKPDGDKKTEDAPKGPIQRKDEPADPADPEELKVRPDEQGKVSFNFRGQAWPDVLDWLADISNTSLDWQELPSDYLNLTTQRAYTVDEVRDLLNERLMTRGYTILQQQEGMVVAKLEGLNPARVPRVHAEDLRYCDDHEFVKVSFPLSWLIAEDAVEELKPMLSKHGTMSALATSNRLEVMDVVTNLRQMQHVLQEEQSSEVRSAKVHEFFLRYTRAEDVMNQLESLLGMQKAGGGGGMMNPQMMQQMQQMQQQMMQQMQQAQQQGGNKSRRRPSGNDDIHLVINSRQNSIIANAPPDKLVVIAEAVKMFDVPPQPGATIGSNFQRVQVFRLAQLDPKALQAMLLQAGNLDPSTQLVADDKNKALIAYATPADKITIEALISKLDGSGRQFKVIRLRRLQADYVAGSIRFMMGEGEEEEENNNRRGGYYSYYGFGQQQQDTKSKDKFRVDADVINNRLLLWANDIELESIENLLIQLGEIPAGGDSQRGRLRTLEIGSSEDADKLLKKLKEVWPQVSPAPLEIDLPDPKREEPPSEQDQEVESKPQRPKDDSVTRRRRIAVPVHLASVMAEDNSAGETPTAARQTDTLESDLENLSQQELKQRYFPEAKQPSSDKPKQDQPVVIQVDQNGRLTLSSENPALLDLVEDVLNEITPPAKDWEVFELKYAPAYWVSLNLEDFFTEEDEEEDTGRSPWFWDYGREEKKEDPLRLSQRKKLKFLADSDTNTIVVQNATSEQLATIRDLIKLYDKPEPVAEEKTRLNSTYAVRYSRATAIAESVKEVFRDLLSSNDKSLQQPAQGGGDREKTPERYSSDLLSRSGSAFKGKLSIGVDSISNTLLISAEGEPLMNLVMDMVKRIDESAKQASTVRVVNLRTGIGGDKIRELLNQLLEKNDPNQQQQPNQNPNGQPNGNQPQNPNGPRGPRGGWQNGNQPQAIQIEN